LTRLGKSKQEQRKPRLNQKRPAGWSAGLPCVLSSKALRLNRHHRHASGANDDGGANIRSWYAAIFGNAMVLGYNSKSRFAAELKQVGTNEMQLYEILQQKGFRLGRGDPELEPKGYRTLFLLDLAEKYYRRPGLAMKILHDPDHPTLVFPEEQVVARLEAGQIDAGIFYRYTSCLWGWHM